MARTYTQMTGKELISKILSGERDFRNINLICSDLPNDPNYEQLKDYLLKADLKENRLRFDESRLLKLQAPGLNMVRTNFKNTNLGEANFKDTNLIEASFWETYAGTANFGKANLQSVDFRYADVQTTHFKGTDLTYANFTNANLGGSYFKEADLKKTDLGGADLRDANLVNVLNLDKAINLGLAVFENTKVTAKEKMIIKKARRKINLFNLITQ
jgi:uncharacterized protein YjbI with pentapeptide repeats